MFSRSRRRGRHRGERSTRTSTTIKCGHPEQGWIWCVLVFQHRAVSTRCFAIHAQNQTMPRCCHQGLLFQYTQNTNHRKTKQCHVAGIKVYCSKYTQNMNRFFLVLFLSFNCRLPYYPELLTGQVTTHGSGWVGPPEPTRPDP